MLRTIKFDGFEMSVQSVHRIYKGKENFAKLIKVIQGYIGHYIGYYIGYYIGNY